MEDIPDFTIENYESSDTYDATETIDECDLNIENIPIIYESDLLETLEKTSIEALSLSLQSFNPRTVTNRPLADSNMSQNNTSKKATRGISSTMESSNTSNNLGKYKKT